MDSTKTDKVKSTSHSVSVISPPVASNSEATSPKRERPKAKAGWFAKILLLCLTLGAVIIGVGAGLLLRNSKLSDDTKRLIAFPGEIFMNMLKMMVLPLVITSLMTGLAQITGNNMGRLIGITFSLYGLTTILAVITGIALVLAIHPGDDSYVSKFDDKDTHFDRGVSAIDSVMDMIRNLFPPNLFEAFLKQAQTKIETKEIFNTTTNKTDTKQDHKIVYRDGSNILGLIGLCMAVGICLSKMGKEKNRVVVEFLTVLDEVVTVLVRLIMWYSPIGILSFVIEKILNIPDLLGVLAMLSKFIGTVAVGLVIQSFLTLPLLYFAMTRKNPFKVISGMTPACLVGFAACSSGAAMPSSIICVEENLKCSKMVAKFVVPIGITVNMNGTALYEAVAAIFIAQLFGIQLSIGDIFTVSIIATLAGMATAAVPHAGLVTLVMVLASIGLPSNEVQLVFTVDWIVGRLRTMVNVLGDGFVAATVSHYLDRKERKQRAQGIIGNESDSPKSQSVSKEIAEP